MAAPCPAWLKQAWIDWLGPYAIVELSEPVSDADLLTHPSPGRP